VWLSSLSAARLSMVASYSAHPGEGCDIRIRVMLRATPTSRKPRTREQRRTCRPRRHPSTLPRTHMRQLHEDLHGPRLTAQSCGRSAPCRSRRTVSTSVSGQTSPYLPHRLISTNQPADCSLNCRVAGSISAPGSHRTGREPRDSSGSCHPTYGRTPNRQCTNRRGSRR
jgi:hypothetical protein